MPSSSVSINDVDHKINNKGDGKKMSSLIILTEVLFFYFPNKIFASGHRFRPEFSRLPAKLA
jgi:hypothetical protein